MREILILLALVAVGCGSDGNSNSAPDSGVNLTTSGSDAGLDMSESDIAVADLGTTDLGTTDLGTTDSGTPDAGQDLPTTVDTSPLDVMDRPADVYVPADYDSAQAYPLIVLLHGYTASGQIQDFYFGTSVRTTERGFVLVTPDGTRNPEGKRFWNAYWCCDLYDQDIDDVAYISALIESAKQRFNIDPKRVYLLGHSNGGFMSYRMACDVDGIAAIASLAGSGPEDEVNCTGGTASILQIHGTADATIRYDGAAGLYPSAPEMMRRWAARNGCDANPTIGQPLNLVTALPGDETMRETWTGCDDGTTVELWTIEDGGHVPTTNDNFKDGVLDFLLAQESP